MENETRNRILRYVLTPQVVPRIQELFFSGFSYVAFFMAQIYRSARLLPPGHPYLSTSNMGRYGIRHVIAEAAGNLVFSRSNIDQVVVFTVLLVGIVVLFAQIFMLVAALFVQSAYAVTFPSAFGVPPTFFDYFLVPDATHDIAFVILDRVFGVPEMFVDRGGGTTCVVSGVPCFDLGQSTRIITPDTVVYTDYDRAASVALDWPWPFHIALQAMLEVYSIGLLLIAIFVFIYFVAAVVAETAQSGTAFGARFNHVWAPLRIIAAMGALVPLTYNLNSVQWILLLSAKWGSGFATNGWIYFNEMATSGGDTLLGSTDNLVAHPNSPPVNTLLEFMTIVATCKVSYERMFHERTDRAEVEIDAWLVNPQNPGMAPMDFGTTNFADALVYFDYGDIIIRFGELRGVEHQSRDNRVAPFCGELLFQVTEVDQVRSPGAYYILDQYYFLISIMWADISSFTGGGCGGGGFGAFQLGLIGCNIASRYLPIENDPNAPLPTSATLQQTVDLYQDFVDETIAEGVVRQRASPEWTESLSQLGWGGAAVWYNKVAQLNGALTGAAYNLPTARRYPDIMEKVRMEKGAADTDTPGPSRHNVFRGPDRPVVLSDEEDTPIGKAMYMAQKIWREYYTEQHMGGDAFMDVVNAIFGTAGLFDMQRNADPGLQTHPLAQLASIGRTIVDAAIRNLGFSAGAGFMGGILNIFGEHLVGRVGMIASSFLSQLAMIGFSIGFVLFYVIPLLPFIYFFFAVGGWVKGIFEAMVGVPLWAMAHIRIDGNGLPGDAALGGYYLVLEIFLRPMCILFGFLASITIFAAQVQVLHEIWSLAVSNATGFDVNAQKGYDPNQTGGLRWLRGAMDEFFYTVIYAIVVYMLGMSSFKLIDLIPNHILRWMGASISTFGDQSDDPAENLVRNSLVGTNMVSGHLGSALHGMKGAGHQTGLAMQEIFGRAT